MWSDIEDLLHGPLMECIHSLHITFADYPSLRASTSLSNAPTKTLWNSQPSVYQVDYFTMSFYLFVKQSTWWIKEIESCLRHLHLHNETIVSDPLPITFTYLLTPLRSTTNVRFNEHPPLSLPHCFFPPLFNSKSTELLTASGEVLVYYIQWWYHHFESGIAIACEPPAPPRLVGGVWE